MSTLPSRQSIWAHVDNIFVDAMSVADMGALFVQLKVNGEWVSYQKAARVAVSLFVDGAAYYYEDSFRSEENLEKAMKLYHQLTQTYVTIMDWDKQTTQAEMRAV